MYVTIFCNKYYARPIAVFQDNRFQLSSTSQILHSAYLIVDQHLDDFTAYIYNFNCCQELIVRSKIGGKATNTSFHS